MLQQKVKAYAMEKYAGDESKAEEFVEGFMKSAASAMPSGFLGLGHAGDEKTVGGAMFKGLGEALGKGVGGLAISAGLTAIGSAAKSVGRMGLHNDFLRSLERAVSTNRLLREEPDRAKILQYAETIFKFAPNVACDSNLLSSILANAIHGEGIDPMTIKTLTELEGRFTENTSFTPKSYI